MPAIADREYHYSGHIYREGETLWPDKFSLGSVMETKKVLGSHFEPIYQQEPGEQTGNIFSRGDWRLVNNVPGNVKRTVQSWDTGFKTGSDNSYSACTTWCETDSGYYLVDAFWGRLTFPELRRAAEGLYDEYRPDEVIIEDKASGQSLIQELRETTSMPVRAIKPVGDKEARAEAVLPLFETGNVYILSNREWTDSVIDSCAKFPRAGIKDIVDSVTQALEYLRRGRGFKYSYHGGAYGRKSGRKTIFDLEKENRDAG